MQADEPAGAGAAMAAGAAAVAEAAAAAAGLADHTKAATKRASALRHRGELGRSAGAAAVRWLCAALAACARTRMGDALARWQLRAREARSSGLVAQSMDRGLRRTGSRAVQGCIAARYLARTLGRAARRSQQVRLCSALRQWRALRVTDPGSTTEAPGGEARELQQMTRWMLGANRSLNARVQGGKSLQGAPAALTAQDSGQRLWVQATKIESEIRSLRQKTRAERVMCRGLLRIALRASATEAWALHKLRRHAGAARAAGPKRPQGRPEPAASHPLAVAGLRLACVLQQVLSRLCAKAWGPLVAHASIARATQEIARASCQPSLRPALPSGVFELAASRRAAASAVTTPEAGGGDVEAAAATAAAACPRQVAAAFPPPRRSPLELFAPPRE